MMQVSWDLEIPNVVAHRIDQLEISESMCRFGLLQVKTFRTCFKLRKFTDAAEDPTLGQSNYISIHTEKKLIDYVAAFESRLL